MSVNAKVFEKIAQVEKLLEEIKGDLAVTEFRTPSPNVSVVDTYKPDSYTTSADLPPVENAPPVKSELKVDWTKLDYLEYGVKIKPQGYLESEIWGNINKTLFADGYRWSKEDRAWVFHPEETGKSTPKKAAPAKDKPSKVTRISDIGDRKSATIEGELMDDPTYKDFNRKDGTVGSVTSFRVNDGSGQARVSMWDDKAKYAMSFVNGDRVRLTSLMVKEPYEGMIQLSGGKFTEITKL